MFLAEYKKGESKMITAIVMLLLNSVTIEVLDVKQNAILRFISVLALICAMCLDVKILLIF